MAGESEVDDEEVMAMTEAAAEYEDHESARDPYSGEH